MNKVRASMTVLALFGAALMNFVGCTPDEPPPDTSSGGAGGSSSSGMMTSCGDGKLDMNEACDDGNNVSGDGCTSCIMDECYDCTANPDMLSTCMPATSGIACQSTKVCDGAGKCVECVEDAQCNGGYCYQNACAKCDDTVQNGDETDTDCGGAHCSKCVIAKKCGVGGDCELGFCVDGVCCAEACDGACFACNIVGSEGTCDFIAKYGEDPVYGMGMSCTAADNKACNGGGTCGAAVGQPCQGNTGCASGKCSPMKVCVKNVDEPCTMNSECLSDMCDPGTMKCL